MKKVKYVKLENPDGSYSSSIPLSVSAEYIDINSATENMNLADYIDENNSNISTLQATDIALNTQIGNNTTAIRGLASGAPKGAYDTVANLISANPNTGVYVVTADGHIYSWTKNGSSAVDLGIYQATVGDNQTYLRNYVEYAKLYNLVNFDKRTEGYINGPNGYINANSQYYTTDFIPVKANETILCFDVRKFLAYDLNKKPYTNSYQEYEQKNYTYTVLADGYIRATMYYSNIGEDYIINITNATAEEIAQYKEKKKYKALNDDVNLSVKQTDEIISMFEAYDYFPIIQTKIDYNQYQRPSEHRWISNDNVDTYRYPCERGKTYKITTSCHGDSADWSLIYIDPQGSHGTLFFKQGPAEGNEDYYLKDYVIEIPSSFPTETGEFLIPRWNELEISVKRVEIGLLATKQYVNEQNDNLEESLKDEIETTEDNLENQISALEETISGYLEKIHESNLLWGKKYVACGDSFTHGDFNGYVDPEGHTGTASDAYDSEWGCYKTYPYWIAKRNNMTLINEAVNGSTITNPDDAGSRRFAYQRYMNIPADADYITLKFGINDSASHQNMPIGTINDTETNTFYGAWNVVLTWLITNRPNAKIGILIGNGLNGPNDEPYCEAMRLIAKKFGIPYLDEDLDDQVPLTFRTNKNVDPTIASLRQSQYRVTSSNGHPNVACHKEQSAFVENFLRSL